MPYLYHAFISAKTDSADSGLVRPTNWNDRLEYSNSGSTGPSGTDALVREVLTAPRTYYVRTDGSDSNTGLVNTAAGAFLTITKAINSVAALDGATFATTISVGNGTYTEDLTLPQTLGTSVSIVGDTVTPSNVVISGTTFCVTWASSSWLITGFKFAGATAIHLYGANAGVLLTVGAVEFGATTKWHVLNIAPGAFTNFYANYTISGGADAHWLVGQGASVTANTLTITVTGTPAFTSFANATDGGTMLVPGNTFVGSATGSRYSSTLNSVIDTRGGGANYLPGNSAGSTATGGQYA